jgi:hypothetical protein
VALSSDEKAAKRAEVAERRARNKAALEVLPIARKQARLMSMRTGVQEDLLYNEAVFGLSKALVSSDGRQYGHYSFCKQSAIGYMLNYLRDSHRQVRIPRRLSEIYLAERRAERKLGAEWARLTDEARAEHLGITLPLLLESRSAVTLFSSELDCQTQRGDLVADSDRLETDCKQEAEADVLQQVIELGVAELSKRTRLPESELLKATAAAIRAIAQEAANRDLL